MKAGETKIISERQFTSEIEEYVEENPKAVRKIVEESAWFKRRNQKIPHQHTSLWEALISHNIAN